MTKKTSKVQKQPNKAKKTKTLVKSAFNKTVTLFRDQRDFFSMDRKYDGL